MRAFLKMHWESVCCQIHVCQLNSKGSTGSQTCISSVILIFIDGMVSFRRNSTTVMLAPLGHRTNKHEDPHTFQKHTPKKLVNLLLIKSRKFPSYTCRISLPDCEHMWFHSCKGCIYNVDGITASGVHHCCGHTTI